MNKHQIMFLIFIIILNIITLSCKKPTEPPDPPPPPPPPVVEQPELFLMLDDAHCTEAWILIKTEKLKIPAEIILKQFNPNGSSISKTINLYRIDTLIHIDSLYPNQRYNYQVTAYWNPKPDSQLQVTSNKISVTTMDTTSHNFTFETFTFGQSGNSILYDVAIINENNIWAVGAIYMRDSLGNHDPNAYNAVHWDGSEWKLKRIYTYSNCSSVDYAPLKSIYAFSSNKIVVTSGGGMWWFDGSKWIAECSINPLLTGAINKLWGSSSNDLYAVGYGGNIAHWDGVRWRKINSGTDMDFFDIYGATDSKTGEQQILAVCTRDLPLRQGIYAIKGNTATKVSSYPIKWVLDGVWFIPNRRYYVVGSGIYKKKFLSDSTWKNGPLAITRYGISGIRGNQLNNVFVAGAFGEFLHYNGISWKSYINELGKFNGSYGKIAIKDNIVVTVGYELTKAKILIGKK